MDIDYIDIGVNILDESFKKDLDEVLDRAFSANVCVLINTSSSIEDAKRSLDLTKKHSLDEELEGVADDTASEE